MMTHEELVEKVARRIFSELFSTETWDPAFDFAKYHNVTLARAAIAAITEALKEPTPEMVGQALDTNNLMRPGPGVYTDFSGDMIGTWQAMLAASPLYPKEAAK